MYREAVDVEAPAVPAGDNGADDIALGHSHKERLGISSQQSYGLGVATRMSCRTAFSIPQVDDVIDVACLGRSYLDHRSIVAVHRRIGPAIRAAA